MNQPASAERPPAGRGGAHATWWATHELVEYLGTLIHSADEGEAVRQGLELAAEAVEAEIAALLGEGGARRWIGASEAAQAALLTAAGSARSRPVDLPELGRCAVVTVPVGSGTGLSMLLGRLGGQRFSAEEVNLLRGMGSALGMSLETLRLLQAERQARLTSERSAAENAALARDLQERRLLLERLARIQRSISRRAPLPEVLQAVTAGAAELLDDDIAVLRVIDPTDALRTIPVASVGVSGPLASEHLSLHEGVSGLAIREDRAVVVDRQAGDPRALAWLGKRDGGCAMAAPVHEQGRVVGALVVSSSTPERCFRAVEVEVLEAFAQHASLALTDARTVEAMELAYHDALTGLASRALFVNRLEDAAAAGRPRGARFALLYLDVDGFKLINDSLGHAAGDALLVQIGDRIRGCLRRRDFAGRLGGDEFAILMEGVRRPADALRLARRLLDALAAPFALEGKPVTVSGSIGIALSRVGEARATEMLRNADLAMYRAKAQGRKRYVLFEPQMYASALARLELEGDLRRSMEAGELRVQFQPIVDMATERMRGFEALVRWQHPTRGLISPLDFIPVAEEIGVIHELERWVLREALAALATVLAQLPRRARLEVSVNLSPLSIGHPDLVADVHRALGEAGIPPHMLTMEVTESALLRGDQATIHALRRLKEMGVRLAIDDFGAGYSSLTYLTMCDFDVLKVDRTFIKNMVGAGEAAPIARAILAMARILDLEVIAEGVETVSQLARLREMGCPLAQGDHFARPLDLPDLAARLHREHARAGRGVILDLPLMRPLPAVELEAR